MLTLAGFALPAVTGLFASIIPLLLISLGSLLSFSLERAAKIPKYITFLILLYHDSDPDSKTRKYTTGALLILGGILTFIAHSLIPFTGVPVIGVVTTPVAVLISLVVILATLDIVTQLNEPYLNNMKTIYNQDFQNMQDDLLSIQAQLGPSWKEVVSKIQNSFDKLNPKIAEFGTNISTEINKYFSDNLHELAVYVNSKTNSKIILNKSEIQLISESLEPWKKVGGSLVLGSLTGTGTGMAASSMAAAHLAPAAWWSPFVPGAIQSWLVGGKMVVGASTFGSCTVAAPIAVGLTIGTGIFGATMVTLNAIEKQKLSEFLADVVIASLPMLRADGKLSEEEKISIQQLLANPQILQKDIIRVKTAMDSHDSFDDIIIKNLLYEKNEEKALIKRKLLLSITWEIAKADGKIEQQELELHVRMAKILQVPIETVNEIRYLITPSFQKSYQLSFA